MVVTVFRMTSSPQAFRAVMRLKQMGVHARLLPNQPPGSVGRCVEVKVASEHRATATAILRWDDPVAEEIPRHSGVHAIRS